MPVKYTVVIRSAALPGNPYNGAILSLFLLNLLHLVICDVLNVRVDYVSLPDQQVC